MNISEAAKSGIRMILTHIGKGGCYDAYTVENLQCHVQAAINTETEPFQGEIDNLKDELLSKNGEIERLKKELEAASNDRDLYNGQLQASRRFVEEEKSRADAAEKRVSELQDCIDRMLPKMGHAEMTPSISNRLKQSESALAATRKALEKLVNRLEFVHADEKYKAVWTYAHIHRMPYDGPKYEDELNAAKESLSTDAGRGWLSPEDAERLKAEVATLKVKLEHEYSANLGDKEGFEELQKTALRREPFEALFRWTIKHGQHTPECKPGTCDCGYEDILIKSNAELSRTKGGDSNARRCAVETSNNAGVVSPAEKSNPHSGDNIPCSPCPVCALSGVSNSDKCTNCSGVGFVISGTFGDRLKWIRENRNLTQSELAEKSGFHPAAISHFETGNRLPSYENLIKLAVVLGTSTDHLCGLTHIKKCFTQKEIGGDEPCQSQASIETIQCTPTGRPSPVSVQPGDGAYCQCPSCPVHYKGISLGETTIDLNTGEIIDGSDFEPIEKELDRIREIASQETDWSDPKSWEQFPPWVMAIAKDKQGFVHGYEHLFEGSSINEWVSEARQIYLPHIQIPGDWKSSVRVRPYVKEPTLPTFDSKTEFNDEACDLLEASEPEPETDMTEVRETAQKVEDQRAWDRFAAQAIQRTPSFKSGGTWEDFAKNCGTIADAMMAEREKRRAK